MKTLLLLTLFSTVAFSQPKDRLATKNILDGFTAKGTPKKYTVAELEKLPLIKVGNSTPRLKEEEQLIQVTGKIVLIKHELDGDIHCEVSDGTCKDSTIACEFPEPTLTKSPFNPQFIKARRFILGKKVGDTVTITGVFFQDKKHGRTTKRIQNYLEIHPCLEMSN